MTVADIRKTIAAAVFGFGSTLAVAVTDGNVPTAAEWLAILAGTLVTTAGVWYVPNGEK